MSVRSVLLATTAACFACGGGGSAFNGAIKGQSKNVHAQISANAMVTAKGMTLAAGVIVITDAASACSALGGNNTPSNSRALEILVFDFNNFAFSWPAGTGVFTIYALSGNGLPKAHAAVAIFRANDASCNDIAAQSANGASGSVTLTKNSGGAYAGNYDITFDSGDRVTGSFNASVCAGIANWTSNSTHNCI
jgi:hypothetical protein